MIILQLANYSQKPCSKPGKNCSIWELKKSTPAKENHLKWKRRLRSLRGGRGGYNYKMIRNCKRYLGKL